ncbi:MAG: transposase [Bellilinea sp.]
MKLLSVITNGKGKIPLVKLSPIGTEVEKSISYINENLQGVTFENFVIMPNHIHLIVILDLEQTRTLSLADVIGRLKSFTNKRFNQIQGVQSAILWQRSYYDHVIRDEEDYGNIWDYIDQNPVMWLEDEYFAD